jgi:hypothetical protein
VYAFLAVLVPSVVAEPDVVAGFDQGERQGAFCGGETYPYFGVHEEAVVQVDDGFAGRPSGRGLVCIAWGGKTVNAEEISVLGEDDVLFVLVPVYGAECAKVAGFEDALCDFAVVCVCWGARGLAGGGHGGGAGGGEAVEEAAGLVVEPDYDGFGEEEDDETEEGFDGDEEEAEDEGEVFTPGKSADEGDVRHNSVAVGVLVAVVTS